MSPKASPRKTGSKDVRPARQRKTNAQLQQQVEDLTKEREGLVVEREGLLSAREAAAKKRDAASQQDVRDQRALRQRLDELAERIEALRAEVSRREAALRVAVEALDEIAHGPRRRSVRRAKAALAELEAQANAG